MKTAIILKNPGHSIYSWETEDIQYLHIGKDDISKVYMKSLQNSLIYLSTTV